MKTVGQLARIGAVTVLALASLVSAAPPQRHAVIVGINDYADPAIPDLKYAESDAMAVYAALADPNVGRFAKQDVALLLGKEATAGNIKAALHALRGVGKDDLVVVFYSGHGAKEGDEAFWVTQDARRAALPATALPNADIRRFLANIPSQRLVVLLDCCYAASTVKKSLDDPGKLFGDFAGKGRVTIAGAAESQEALEMPSAKAGLFTHFLVAGLRGKADTNADGAVTFDELWNYLGENVRKASVKQGGLHEPKIITEDGITPQFLLTYNPSAKAAGDKAVTALRSLFDAGKITGSQYDEGRAALMEPAIDAASAARREVYADLAAGKLDPKYLVTALKTAGGEPAAPPAAGDAKPAIAVLPFDVLGRIDVPRAGEMIAERLLPMFGDKYALVDQMQLKRFIDQDDLTVSGLTALAVRPATKALTSKAIKLRAVRYLVLGSISASPDGGLSVTARLSDWQTGRIESGRVGQVAADNWTDLLRRLPLLAAKLTGTLGDIGPGPEDKLPPLPTGVDALTARILQLEAIEAELKKAQETLTEKHPRIAFLRDTLTRLAGVLTVDVDAKLTELAAEDTKLAHLYREVHPQRVALAEQMSDLRKARAGVLVRVSGSQQVVFFGSQTRAHHIVYVVDRSGSMAPTFDEVRIEMLKSISLLSAAQDFHIVFYSNNQVIEGPRNQLVAADVDNKLLASRFLESVSASGQTTVLPGLQRAFSALKYADPNKPGKLICLLSDGDFAGVTGGSSYKSAKGEMLNGNDAVVAWLRDTNTKKEVRVNTFLFREKQQSALKVMQIIAAENGGQFRFVSADDPSGSLGNPPKPEAAGSEKARQAQGLVDRRMETLKEAAVAEINKSLGSCRRSLASAYSAGDFDNAEKSVREAKATLEANKAYFGVQDYIRLLTTIDEHLDVVLVRRESWQKAVAEVQRRQIEARKEQLGKAQGK